MLFTESLQISRHKTLANGESISHKQTRAVVTYYPTEFLKTFNVDMSTLFTQHAKIVKAVRAEQLEENRVISGVSYPKMSFESYNIAKKPIDVSAKEHGAVVKSVVALQTLRDTSEQLAVANMRNLLSHQVDLENAIMAKYQERASEFKMPAVDQSFDKLSGDDRTLLTCLLNADQDVVEISHEGVKFLDIQYAKQDAYIVQDLIDAHGYKLTVAAAPIDDNPFGLVESDIRTNFQITSAPQDMQDAVKIKFALVGNREGVVVQIHESSVGYCLVRQNEYLINLVSGNVIPNTRGEILPLSSDDSSLHPYFQNMVISGSFFINIKEGQEQEFLVDRMQRVDLEGANHEEQISKALQKKASALHQYQLHVAEGTASFQKFEQRKNSKTTSAAMSEMANKGTLDEHIAGLKQNCGNGSESFKNLLDSATAALAVQNFKAEPACVVEDTAVSYKVVDKKFGTFFGVSLKKFSPSAPRELKKSLVLGHPYTAEDLPVCDKRTWVEGLFKQLSEISEIQQREDKLAVSLMRLLVLAMYAEIAIIPEIEVKSMILRLLTHVEQKTKLSNYELCFLRCSNHISEAMLPGYLREKHQDHFETLEACNAARTKIDEDFYVIHDVHFQLNVRFPFDLVIE